MKFITATAIVLLCGYYYNYSIEQESFHCVSYTLDHGRFGDCLIVYTKALWVSYTKNYRLLHVPFTYTDRLALHTIDQKLPSDYKNSFISIIPIKKQNDIKSDNKQKSAIYFSNLFFMDDAWNNNYVSGMRKNKLFIEHLKSRIKPIGTCNLITPPEGYVTVAMHVRQGGGFDRPLLMRQEGRSKFARTNSFADVRFPFKFTPDSYFIEQLKKIQILFPDKKLYVYLFTDDQHPEQIAKNYSQQLDDNTIFFDYRKTENRHDKNVLEDLFSMAYSFDCLIRTESAFSQIAHLIGNHKLIFWPEQFMWDKDNTLRITEVGCELVKDSPVDL